MKETIKENLIVGNTYYRVAKLFSHQTRSSSDKYEVRELIFKGIHKPFHEDQDTYYEFEYTGKTSNDRYLKCFRLPGREYKLFLIYVSKQDAIEKAKQLSAHHLKLEIDRINDHLDYIKEEYQKHINSLDLA